MGVYRVQGNQIVHQSQPNAVAPTATFQAVGPGLPLTVQIKHVYTGRFPNNPGNSANMLVTSSIKSLDTFNASAEAVNFLMPKQHSRKDYVSPPADQNGTPLVCYVPAVTAVSTTITFNLVFQRFDDSILSTISSVFSGAASIPLFLSASPYLIGATSVLKLAGDIGDAIFNGTPDFSPTVVLNFSDPTDPVQQSGFLVLFKDEEDRTLDPSSLTLETEAGRHGLIDPSTNRLYAGPAPYIVISIDGTKQDSLTSFAPTAATASILAKFFNIKDGGPIPTQDVMEALKVANDLKYRKEAIHLQGEINNASDDDKLILQKQLDAVIKNILNEELRPKPQVMAAANE